MTTGKWIGLIIIILLVAGAVADAVRYLQLNKKNQIAVQSQQQKLLPGTNEIIMVYNANAGVYPGIADVIHKAFFPKTYPCNLCFLAFGTFGKKEAWTNFLKTIPYQKAELHKDEFCRKYLPKNFPLPAILMSNGKDTRVLVTASEINQQHTLTALIQLVQSKL